MILHRTGSTVIFATAVNRITSQSLLEPVITDLKLGAQWARKFRQSQDLSVNKCYTILKGSMAVSQPAGSSVIEIRVFADDRDEAATIANKIAEVYCRATPGAAIIAQAQPNPRPARPNKPRNILFGLFAGMVLATLGVCLLMAARKPKPDPTTAGIKY